MFLRSLWALLRHPMDANERAVLSSESEFGAVLALCRRSSESFLTRTAAAVDAATLDDYFATERLDLFQANYAAIAELITARLAGTTNPALARANTRLRARFEPVVAAHRSGPSHSELVGRFRRYFETPGAESILDAITHGALHNVDVSLEDVRATETVGRPVCAPITGKRLRVLMGAMHASPHGPSAVLQSTGTERDLFVFDGNPLREPIRWDWKPEGWFEMDLGEGIVLRHRHRVPNDYWARLVYVAL